MMRKFLSIASITLLFFGLNAHGQEKQNDATIQETISWINEYGVKNMTILDSEHEKPFLFYKDSDGSIVYQYEGSDFAFVRIVNEKNSKMIISSSNRGCKVGIYPTQFRRNSLWNDGKPPYGKFNFGSNKEYALKVFKAFEHLFYLLEWKVECINDLVDENKF
jgi:hypothetical protein